MPRFITERVQLAVLVKVIHASCQRRYAERHLFPGSNIPGNAPNFHSSSYRSIPRSSRNPRPRSGRPFSKLLRRIFLGGYIWDLSRRLIARINIENALLMENFNDPFRTFFFSLMSTFIVIDFRFLSALWILYFFTDILLTREIGGQKSRNSRF